jgi:trk system potassium uptake protein TrkA
MDLDPEPVGAVADEVSLAVVGDATSERVLRDHGIDAVDVAVISMGECFEATQLCAVLLKKLGVRRVIVKSSVPVRIRILERIGADEIVSPEMDSASRLALKLRAPNLLDYLDLIGGRSLVQLRAPAAMAGKSIGELDIRRRFGVNVIAIRSGEGEEERVNDLPRPEDVIGKDDVLVVIGGEEEILKLAK